MTLVALIALTAVVTVGSRVAALAVLPAPRGRAATVVGRLPAALFAALAAVSLLDSPGGPSPASLAAVVCAALASRRSSLLVSLVAGLVGFAVTSSLLG